ncbi:Uncharacterised protein [Serratia quinivorans]|nr:Uncharacterised protein [Serratia quinivorans]
MKVSLINVLNFALAQITLRLYPLILAHWAVN